MVCLQSFLRQHWLDASLMVILVNFAVNGRGDVLVLSRLDMLLSDGSVDILVDGSLVLAILGQEAGGCLLCLLHCCGCMRCDCS